MTAAMTACMTAGSTSTSRSAAALEADPKAELLRLALLLGVPMRIGQYQRERRSTAWLVERAAWAGDVLAAHGDVLLYRTKAKTSGGQRLPSTAEVCNAVVEGVACAALVAAGGITVLGLHFDADPTDPTDPEKPVEPR